MGFLEKKMQDGEEQAAKILDAYRQALTETEETTSVIHMASSGAPAGSVGQRAADAHRALFSNVLKTSNVKFVSRSKTRSAIVEQFCIAMWRHHLGDDGYVAMTEELGLAQAKP